MIRLEHLAIGYGSRILLSDVSTELPAGALAALVGRNGSGWAPWRAERYGSTARLWRS